MDVFSEIIVLHWKGKNAVVKIDKYSNIGETVVLTDQVQDCFSSDGLILTNAHVYWNSDRLNFSYFDGMNSQVKQLNGIRHDIAIIKVFGSGYHL